MITTAEMECEHFVLSLLYKTSSRNGGWQTGKGKKVKRMLSEHGERLDKLSVSVEQDEKEALRQHQASLLTFLKA